MKVVCPCCARHPGKGRLQLYHPDGKRAENVECCHCSGEGEIEAEQFGRGRNISDITSAIAQAVRECREKGEGARTIAERFGISMSAVYKIDAGHTWRNEKR